MSQPMDGATGTAHFQYPAGVPPFRPPPDQEYLDEYEPFRQADTNLNIEFPRGTTRIQAFEIMYHRFERFKREISLEVSQAHFQKLKFANSLEHIRASISKPHEDYLQTVRDLGIELPPGLMLDLRFPSCTGTGTINHIMRK